MKYIPILMSGPMVRALLEGHKTQTRRLRGLDNVNKNPNEWEFVQCFTDDDDGCFYAGFKLKESRDTWMKIKCPYGIKGDRLWVRECWNYLNAEKINGKYQVCYRATDEKDVTGSAYGTAAKWRPSIHMPRWASRITLENTVNPRIERLQDITEEACYSEGCAPGDYEYSDGEGTTSAKESYQNLWILLNGEESWDKNPYVWVVEFKILNQEGI